MSRVLLQVVEAFSVQEIREISHAEARRTEVILWPARHRYLWNPASVAADDGLDVLAAAAADPCKCCGGKGRWERWQISADGGGGGGGLTEEQVIALIQAQYPSQLPYQLSE